MIAKLPDVRTAQTQQVPPATQPNQRLILVAMDGGEPAHWALDVAATLACQTPAKLMLLHVVLPASGAGGEFVASLERLDLQHHQESEAKLDRVRQTLPASNDCQCVVREGCPADEIVAVAERLGADLIVIGTRGRGGLARLILGSTAEAVVRQAPCPVVTVGHRAAWATPLAAHLDQSAASAFIGTAI